MGQVTTTFFADSQAAEAAIARLEAKYLKLENQLKQVSRKSKEDANSAGQALEQWGLKSARPCWRMRG